MPRRLRVFLSYSRADPEVPRDLFFTLPSEEYTVFYEYCIFPGDDWEFTIKNAVARADVVLVCLSKSATDRRGYLQKELRLILEEAERVPEGRSYVIPLLLDDCVVPTAFRRWQWLRYNGGAREHNFLLQTLRRLKRHIQDDEDDDNGFEALAEPVGDDFNTFKVVVLINGKNLHGEALWAYVNVTLPALRKLGAAMKSEEDFNPADYGEVLAIGVGPVPSDVAARMAEDYNMVTLPEGSFPRRNG